MPPHVIFFVSAEETAQFSVSCSIRVKLEAVQLELMDQSFDSVDCDNDIVAGGVGGVMPVVAVVDVMSQLQLLL
jgi:hypothetical protein